MNDELSGLEILFLWRLGVAGGGEWNPQVKPQPSPAMRQRLERDGFVDVEKRTPPTGGRKIFHFTLTDRGWQWLSEHLNTAFTTKSPASLDVLVRLLARLDTHLKAQGLSLAEFIEAAPRPTPPTDHEDVGRRVEAAYLQITGGRPNVRVRLADLREALAEMRREVLDGALLEMASAGHASLYRLDNPLEIGPRDREAILRTPSGEERHIVYLGGPHS